MPSSYEQGGKQGALLVLKSIIERYGDKTINSNDPVGDVQDLFRVIKADIKCAIKFIEADIRKDEQAKP